MNKRIIAFFLLLFCVTAGAVCAQQNPQKRQMRDVTGTVLKVNVEARILDFKGFLGQMAFFVPNEAVITRQTRPVTLAEVREGDSAFIQYYISSGAVYVVTSIVGSKTTIE